MQTNRTSPRLQHVLHGAQMMYLKYCDIKSFILKAIDEIKAEYFWKKLRPNVEGLYLYSKYYILIIIYRILYTFNAFPCVYYRLCFLAVEY